MNKYGHPTNREKREDLDEKYREKYPDETSSQIIARREAYLRANYGTAFHFRLPLPRERDGCRRILTMQALEKRLISRLGTWDSFFGGLLFAVILLPIGLLNLIAGARGDDLLVMLLGLGMTAMAGWLIFHGFSKVRERKKALQLLRSGEFQVATARVMDMSHGSSGTGEDRHRWYCLHLQYPGEEEIRRVDCRKDDYDEIREGDTVQLIHMDVAERWKAGPVMVFCDKYILPDETLAALLTAAKTRR